MWPHTACGDGFSDKDAAGRAGLGSGTDTHTRLGGDVSRLERGPLRSSWMGWDLTGAVGKARGGRSTRGRGGERGGDPHPGRAWISHGSPWPAPGASVS